MMLTFMLCEISGYVLELHVMHMKLHIINLWLQTMGFDVPVIKIYTRLSTTLPADRLGAVGNGSDSDSDPWETDPS